MVLLVPPTVCTIQHQYGCDAQTGGFLKKNYWPGCILTTFKFQTFQIKCLCENMLWVSLEKPH